MNVRGRKSDRIADLTTVQLRFVEQFSVLWMDIYQARETTEKTRKYPSK
ncbi:hypothetical protein NOGI109294_02505 [Nocardiopsis gilva]